MRAVKAVRWAPLFAGIALLILLLSHIYNEAASKPAWDGTFECRPGETYTTAECE